MNVYRTGWSMSGFDLIARVLAEGRPAQWIGKYWNGTNYEILGTPVLEQPTDTWAFAGVITPDMRFPYGYPVEPDHPA